MVKGRGWAAPFRRGKNNLVKIKTSKSEVTAVIFGDRGCLVGLSVGETVTFIAKVKRVYASYGYHLFTSLVIGVDGVALALSSLL